MIRQLSRPIIVGHRGFRAKYPENTLIGFREAVAAGVEVVELDVSLSKDRHVVVMHDETLERTTNGRGVVRDTSWDVIRRLDAGSWFDKRFAAERVPDLETVFEAIGDRCVINVEIKPDAVEPEEKPDGIETRVADLIHRCGLIERVIVSSFHPVALKRLAALPQEKKPHLAVLSGKQTTFDPFELLQSVCAFSWHPDYRLIGADHIRKAHDLGVLILPYTVNDIQEIRRLLVMGADGIITDDPVTVSASLNNVGSMS